MLGNLKPEPSKVFSGLHTMGSNKVIPNQSVSSTTSCLLTPVPFKTAPKPSDNLIPTTTEKENIAPLEPTTENVDTNIQSTQTVERCEAVPSGATTVPVPSVEEIPSSSNNVQTEMPFLGQALPLPSNESVSSALHKVLNLPVAK